MPVLGKILVLVALFAVTLVLVRGLWNMLKGGSVNLSQRLMRMRVALQLVAVLLCMGALYFGAR